MSKTGDNLKTAFAGESTYVMPRLGPHPNHAPDCLVSNENGEIVAVELCEFVDEKAIKENQRGNEVYRDWQPSEVLKKINKILKKKDEKEYHGGPYAKVIVLIHTDEPVISYKEYQKLLVANEFKSLQKVTESYLLFSYEPGIERCPYIKLGLG